MKLAAPLKLCRLSGRGAGMPLEYVWPIELRLEKLVRLLGRLSPWVRVPTDCRLGGIYGVPSPWTEELKLLPLVRFLEDLRTVMLEGIGLCPDTEPRGEVLLGVSTGAGSLDRADCTRSSNFCIFPMRPRIWYREPDRGSPADWEALNRETLERDVTDGVDRPLLSGIEGARVCRLLTGRPPLFDSVTDILGFLRLVGAPGLRRLVDDSDIVGEGGVTASDVTDDADLAGGVAIVGEEAVVTGECSDTSGVLGAPWLESRGAGLRRL